MHNQKHSEESKKKMSESCKKRWKDKKYRERMRKVHLGQKAWNKGTKGIMKPNSTSFKKGEHPSKKTEFKKGDERITGENNPNWKGGVSYGNEKIRHSLEYVAWRNEVYKKDGWTCRICGSKKKIVAHHLKLFSEFPELRFSVDNGIVLCRSCHLKVHKNLIELT